MISAACANPVPTLLVGGWLGSGKTTLLNHLLRHAEGRRVAVLVNDFGDVNLDAELIVGAEAGLLQLAGGCLCCSFGDDLLGTLRRVATREPRPDHLLIELSGVALPGPVRGLVALVPQVRLSGTLVLADSTHIRQQAQDRFVGDTVHQQLDSADWLLPSKTDLLLPEQRLEVLAWMRQQAPRAQCLPDPAQALPAELVFGWTEPRADTPKSPGAEPAFAQRPLRQTHPGLISRSIALPAGADLASWLHALQNPGWRVLRAKALVGDGQGQGRVLHWAAGRGQLAPLSIERTGGHLVLIGLEAARLDGLCAAMHMT